MNDSYFLTRQTANLMEDFVREIKRGSSLFLLYGETGVGKTSLLRRLTEHRLTEQKIHWIDFELTAETGTSETTPDDQTSLVERTAEAADEGDVIIIDHFESASNRAQHQIFRSWSTDGKDKSLNLIVSATASSFKSVSPSTTVPPHDRQER